MRVTKRILCLLLGLLLVAASLSACGGKKKDPDKGTEPATKANDPAADPATRDDLDARYDFNTEYYILSREETNYEFYTEAGASGSVVEKAVFDRNEVVMDRCAVDIGIQSLKGGWYDKEPFITRVRNNSLENTSRFDLIATHSVYLMSLALEGLGTDFSRLPNIDLSKRWWSEQYYNDVNYNGALYVAVGDIGYTVYEYLMVIFYNEKMANSLGIEDLYDVALDGDWTFERLQEAVNLVSTDLESETPTYGFLANGHGVRAFGNAFDLDILPLENGTREFPLEIPVTLLDPMQQIVDFVRETTAVRYDGGNTEIYRNNSTGVQNPLFISGRSLFYQQMLGQAVYFKAEMEDSYGVIPYPKYNDDQIGYLSAYCDDLTGVMVPKNIKNADVTGTVTEMLCMESYRRVTNAYYESVLKTRAFNDPRCRESLEIIRSSLSPTFVVAYSDYLGTPSSILNNVVQSNGKSTLPTYWAENATRWEGKLYDLFEALETIAAK